MFPEYDEEEAAGTSPGTSPAIISFFSCEAFFPRTKLTWGPDRQTDIAVLGEAEDIALPQPGFPQLPTPQNQQGGAFPNPRASLSSGYFRSKKTRAQNGDVPWLGQAPLPPPAPAPCCRVSVWAHPHPLPGFTFLQVTRLMLCIYFLLCMYICPLDPETLEAKSYHFENKLPLTIQGEALTWR